jgi:uncharacterized protein (DUF433 family)
MAALHRHTERGFSVPEAAVILNQPAKRISNALERDLKPLRLGSVVHGNRTISSKGLMALELLSQFGKWFTPLLRRRVIREALKLQSGDAVTVENGCVVVKIAEHRERVEQGKKRLMEAAALITTDPEVLGGEPCVKGTRVPAYLVGALARKHGAVEAHATYPSIPRQTIELVALYVEANPRKGRPRQAELSKAKAPAKRGKAKKIKID